MSNEIASNPSTIELSPEKEESKGLFEEEEKEKEKIESDKKSETDSDKDFSLRDNYSGVFCRSVFDRKFKCLNCFRLHFNDVFIVAESSELKGKKVCKHIHPISETSYMYHCAEDCTYYHFANRNINDALIAIYRKKARDAEAKARDAETREQKALARISELEGILNGIKSALSRK